MCVKMHDADRQKPVDPLTPKLGHPTDGGTPLQAGLNAALAANQCFVELPVLPYAKCPYDVGK